MACDTFFISVAKIILVPLLFPRPSHDVLLPNSRKIYNQ